MQRHHSPTIAVLLAGVLAGACGESAEAPLGPSTPVVVMSRNLFLGADLSKVVASESVSVVPMRVGEVLAAVRASSPADRMNLIADEIVAAAPHVLSLQEAVVFTVQTPSDFDFAAPAINAAPGAAGTIESIDFLAILQAALVARGVAYQVAVVGSYSDVELPALTPAGVVDVRLLDRNAILVRSDVVAAQPTSQAFVSRLSQFPIGGQESTVRVDVIRGWESLMVTVGPASFTLVNTHLEAGGLKADPSVAVFLNALQLGQAKDLVAVTANLTGPIVLTGDFNSGPGGQGTTAYQTILNTGWKDAQTQPPGPGNQTCCSDLSAPVFTADDRIDNVFVRGRVRSDAVMLTGTAPTPRTAQGFFASEHAGVVTSLSVENPR